MFENLLAAYEAKNWDELRALLSVNPEVSRYQLSTPNLLLTHPDFMVTCLKILEDIERSSS